MADEAHQPDTSVLFLDRSRKRLEDDELGRKGFVRSFWKALRNHDASEAVVLSIQAPWGDGKTTLKEMVVDLEKSEGSPQRLLFVHFNPWEWAAQNQVAAAFFHELGKQIDSNGSKGALKAAQRMLRKSVEHLPAVLGLGKVIAQGVGAAVAPFNPPLAAGIAAGAKVLENSGELAKVTRQAQRDELPKDSPSVEMEKEKVRRAFEKFRDKTKLNIVVFIDDIDRLAADEIRQVLQLVKINADFPGLIFVLLFDKNYVERRLRRHFGADAASFLEKIVQVELQLPPASKDALFQCLDHGIRRALTVRPAYEKIYEAERLKEAFDAWLGLHLTNPRKFGRLLSSWSFRLDVFDSAVAEVNPVDLLILEGLSLYEPNVHRALSQGYTELFPDPYRDMVDGLLRNRDRKPGDPSLRMQALNRTAHQTKEDDSRPVVAVLKLLLGVIGSDFDSKTRDEEALRIRARRFSAPRFFRRYFRLTIDSGEVSNAKIHALVGVIGSPAQFAQDLTLLEREGVLIDALDQLLAQELQLPKDPSNFLAHLLEWWEVRIKSTANSKSSSDLPRRLHGFFQQALKSCKGEGRLVALQSTLRQCSAPFASTEIAFYESSERRRRSESKSLDTSGILTEEGARTFCNEVARRLYEYFKSNRPADPCEARGG